MVPVLSAGRKTWPVLIVVTIAVLLVAACSGGDGPVPGATPTAVSPAGAGKPGGQATEQTPGTLGEVAPPVTPGSNPPPAPVFSFSTVDGDEVQLEEVLGTAPVYVFFVPGVDDELDLAQVGRVQDRYSQFEDLGVYVFLIVSDLPTKVLQLRDEFGLEFPVIADPLNVIATDWMVFDLFGGGKSGPASFVFNAHGVLIARLIAAEPGDRPSVDEVLGVIRESLNAAGV